MGFAFCRRRVLAGPRVALRRFHPGDVAGFVEYRSPVPVARFQSRDAPSGRAPGCRVSVERPDMR